MGPSRNMAGVITLRRQNWPANLVIGGKSFAWGTRLSHWTTRPITRWSASFLSKGMRIWMTGRGQLSYREPRIEFQRIMLLLYFASCGAVSKQRRLKAPKEALQ